MNKNKQIAKLFNLVNESGHNLTTPKGVEAIANKMLEFPQAECSVKHHIGAGVYIRELFVPAGTFLIGHYHKAEHLNQLVKGRVIMLDEDGSTIERSAGEIYTSKAGRKIGLIIEDMIWQNIYPNPENETDADILEDRFVSKVESWNDHVKSNNNFEYISRHSDREDYKKILSDIGVISDQQLSKKSDHIPFPQGSYAIKVSKSNIEGQGLFCLSPIDSGKIIAPAKINGKTTPAGRYTNHAMTPNAKLALTDSGDINLVSLKNIRGCLGGDSGEEITIDYRQSVSLLNNRGALCQ